MRLFNEFSVSFFICRDPDRNDTLEYHLETNPLLAVDATTGQLLLSPNLATDRHFEDTYEACVSG